MMNMDHGVVDQKNNINTLEPTPPRKIRGRWRRIKTAWHVLRTGWIESNGETQLTVKGCYFVQDGEKPSIEVKNK